MAILCFRDIDPAQFTALLSRYGLKVETVEDDANIPGTFWGEPEAGLIGDSLYLRQDTPVHSALHEACHYICMPAKHRKQLHTDAGGNAREEDGTCYLQILLADHIVALDRVRMFADMDEWGYSFRLGSAQAWFEQDADDARAWLQHHGLITRDDEVTFNTRQQS